ncbi:MAG: thioredoxin [Corynebacterium sp.]|nr:thioredoxin [Corynebacterium sp.]
MAIIHLAQDDFNETVNKNDLVVVDFWASWCAPCRRFAPVFEKVSENYEDVVFAKVDVDENQDLAGALGVQSIPTVAIIREGVVVFNQPGVLDAKGLEEVVNKAKELDMDKVRADIAQG